MYAFVEFGSLLHIRRTRYICRAKAKKSTLILMNCECVWSVRQVVCVGSIDCSFSVWPVSPVSPSLGLQWADDPVYQRAVCPLDSVYWIVWPIAYLRSTGKLDERLMHCITWNNRMWSAHLMQKLPTKKLPSDSLVVCILQRRTQQCWVLPKSRRKSTEGAGKAYTERSGEETLKWCH